jgi:hypothetical protein
VHASAILHRCLAPLLVPMHRARLTALFAAVAACVAGPGLTLTDIARRLPGPGGVPPQAQAHRPPGGQPPSGARDGAGLRCPVPGVAERSQGGGDRRGLVGPEGGSVARDCCAPRCRWAGGR